MLEKVAEIISEKATEIAKQETSKYVMENPGIDIPDEIRELVVQRALAQITFNVTSLRITDENELTTEINNWFSEKEEEPLRKLCHDCIKNELAKIHKEDDPNLSFLDRYRMEHRHKSNLTNTKSKN